MSLRPILSSLLRHKTDAALIVLEIALSCAIVCNAVFIIGSRVQYMSRPSGIVENELVDIRVSGVGTDDNADAMRLADVAALAALPGVVAVTSVNQVPYGGNSWVGPISVAPDQADASAMASQYMDDGRLLPTLGLRVVQGRAFLPEEYVVGDSDNSKSVIITRSLARHLFHGDVAVGKPVYLGDSPAQVVGVIDDLVAPGNTRASVGGSLRDFDSMILPSPVSNGEYVLRTEPGRRAEVLAAAVSALQKADPNRIVDAQDTISAMRREFYSRDRSVIWLLLSFSLALLAVTALGIVGMASFWVQQRTKQIGVRRALGATRGQILAYFQVENFILSALGIGLGMMLAFAINQLLMSRYELPRLPVVYLPIAAAVLWLLGQLAVLGPARRAAAVPPAVATRSV